MKKIFSGWPIVDGNARGRAFGWRAVCFAGLWVRQQRRPGVATNKISLIGSLIRHGAWMALVLGILFLSVRGGSTQEETARPVRAPEALRQGIELYKSQEYEKAAPFFEYAQTGQQSLTPGDQKDLV